VVGTGDAVRQSLLHLALGPICRSGPWLYEVDVKSASKAYLRRNESDRFGTDFGRGYLLTSDLTATTPAQEMHSNPHPLAYCCACAIDAVFVRDDIKTQTLHRGLAAVRHYP
jgi:hypothetical protein